MFDYLSTQREGFYISFTQVETGSVYTGGGAILESSMIAHLAFRLNNDVDVGAAERRVGCGTGGRRGVAA